MTNDRQLVNKQTGEVVLGFNNVKWLSGTSTISTNTTGYRNTGGVGTNGQLTQAQLDWNKQYNTSNNALLKQNAQQASLVSQNDMAFSTYFDKDGKLLKFKNDGDYNAYLVDEDDWYYGKSKKIKYADAMKLENITDKDTFEDSMTTDEAQADFYKMYLISDNGGTTAWSTLKSWFTGESASKYEGMSLTERLTDVVKNDTLADYSLKTSTGGSYALKNNEQNKELISALSRGADDFSLSYYFAENLWKGIVDHSKSQVSYPTHTMLNAADIKLTNRPTINPAIGNDNRTLANGTCGSSGCGQVGAVRKGHDHQGNDYLILPGGYVLAVSDGDIYRRGSNTDKSKSLPSYAIINDETGIRDLVLYGGVNPNIPDGTTVRQGGVVGRGVSQSEFDRVYNTERDKNGNVIRILTPADKGYTYQHLHNERMQVDNWSDKTNTLPIVFPKKVPEPLPIRK